jgi:hypothetical protein
LVKGELGEGSRRLLERKTVLETGFGITILLPIADKKRLMQLYVLNVRAA